MATTVEPARPERRQRTTQLIDELQNERRDLWSLYCQIGELKPFNDLEPVKTKLMRFAEVLVDYVSLGHFGLYERILSGTERRESLIAVATDIYPEFSEVTEMSVSFNDKYENAGEASAFASLADDLSALGESLAKRFELEDRLCGLMRR
ncbi:Rsd/AlgQ family anti-sigma factor [Methylomicrobium sp. RS1]|jgi:regulator of sigma D|uniref:Rsd/AlgQ family anti-sigma factor n=1 Tax=Candidatus Methylomicrobium oryzae TaxID=2802053 RepID=UPI0019223801|nr:Rsd/AlgQ family anti-sigma factor [Methylomicrobium sp. RS1]MBL1263129.1 Rsd/AlgQ family anti-sigma factor [Methylomicrobium sp. RS1]